eukprot:scaffold59476_cov19-Prasinocladus_malaysianus.AAC.1
MGGHCHNFQHYLMMGLKGQIIISHSGVPDMPEGMAMTCGSQAMWDDVRSMAGLDSTAIQLNRQARMMSG